MHLRLALYSDQEIEANALMNDRVLDLIGVSSPRIGYVSSAPDHDRSYFNHKRAYYAELGIELTCYIDSELPNIEQELVSLTECDGIHLTGGNTYSFLRWLKVRGVLPAISQYAKAGGVLIGASAGSILMTPTIEIAELSPDTPDPSMVDYSALGLAEFHFWPHYTHGSNLSPEAQRIVRRLGKVYGCPDGSGIVIDGECVERIGSVELLNVA